MNQYLNNHQNSGKISPANANHGEDIIRRQLFGVDVSEQRNNSGPSQDIFKKDSDKFWREENANMHLQPQEDAINSIENQPQMVQNSNILKFNSAPQVFTSNQHIGFYNNSRPSSSQVQLVPKYSDQVRQQLWYQHLQSLEKIFQLNFPQEKQSHSQRKLEEENLRQQQPSGIILSSFIDLDQVKQRKSFFGQSASSVASQVPQEKQKSNPLRAKEQRALIEEQKEMLFEKSYGKDLQSMLQSRVSSNQVAQQPFLKNNKWQILGKRTQNNLKGWSEEIFKMDSELELKEKKVAYELGLRRSMIIQSLSKNKDMGKPQQLLFILFRNLCIFIRCESKLQKIDVKENLRKICSNLSEKFLCTIADVLEDAFYCQPLTTKGTDISNQHMEYLVNVCTQLTNVAKMKFYENPGALYLFILLMTDFQKWKKPPLSRFFLDSLNEAHKELVEETTRYALASFQDDQEFKPKYSGDILKCILSREEVTTQGNIF